MSDGQLHILQFRAEGARLMHWLCRRCRCVYWTEQAFAEHQQLREQGAEQYDYLEYDGAYFRRHRSVPGAPVEEVFWPKQGWVRYAGPDRIKPAWYGDRIEESELPVEVRPK
jgi:hypothetical protein